MGLGIAPLFSTTINCRINHTLLLPVSLSLSRRCSLTPWKFSSQSVQKKACGVVRSKVEAEEETDEEACELVNGVELTIGDGVDSIRAHLFHAVKNNNGAGILLLSDIFGFQNSSTRDFAYRTACNGYNVLVPDLFRGDPWSKEQAGCIEQWLATHDIERVAEDIEACAKWMVEEFLAAGISNKLGIVGFCYGGGRVIEVLARDHGSRFATGVSFYGTRIDRSAAAHVKVPVLFITGDEDSLCPVDGLLELVQIMGNSSSKVEVFEGREHGFAHNPQSNEDDADAEKAFLTMRNWLHHHLLPTLV